jgi:hypothetical protein
MMESISGIEEDGLSKHGAISNQRAAFSQNRKLKADG